MVSVSTFWNWLERWRAVAFIIGGGAMFGIAALAGLELVVYGERFQVIQEWFIAVIAIPSSVAIFAGLLGLYPYLAEHSPKLALGGAITAAIGGLSLIVAVGASLVLDLLGILAFTAGEENPILLTLFFVMMIAFFLSLLLTAITSIRTRRPSRIAGLLLLVPVVEPGSVILMDIVGVELGSIGALGTLGIAGIALFAVGYLLRGVTPPVHRGEPAPDSPA